MTALFHLRNLSIISVTTKMIKNIIITVVMYASGKSNSEYAYVIKNDITPAIIDVGILKKFKEPINTTQPIAIGNKILSILFTPVHILSN